VRARRVEGIELSRRPGEEGPDLGLAPRRDLGVELTRWITELGCVAVELSPPDRVAERPVDDGVDVVHGLLRQPAGAVDPPGVEQLDVEAVEVGGADLGERDLPEAGQNVMDEVGAVAVPGRGLERRPHRGEPLRNEAGEALCRRLCGAPGQGGDGGVLAVFAPPVPGGGHRGGEVPAHLKAAAPRGASRHGGPWAKRTGVFIVRRHFPSEAGPQQVGVGWEQAPVGANQTHVLATGPRAGPGGAEMDLGPAARLAAVTGPP